MTQGLGGILLLLGAGCGLGCEGGSMAGEGALFKCVLFSSHQDANQNI